MNAWWIKHDGAGMPVPSDQLVRVRSRDGWESARPTKAGDLSSPIWSKDRWWNMMFDHDIVAYQICDPDIRPNSRAFEKGGAA